MGKFFLIETDILLALISPEDKHHNEALQLLEKFEGRLVLSPYSLLELDLIIRARGVIISDIKEFYSSLHLLLEYRRVKLIPSKPIYHLKAHELRRKYNELTYFDSLHASVGASENLELVSYDNIYANLIELRFKHARAALKL